MIIAYAIILSNSCSANNQITVDCTKSIGEVNKYIFGNNVLAHDPAFSSKEPWAKNFHGYREYGAGLWNPVRMEPVSNVMQLGKEAGISIMRFPGGCGSHGYEWKKAVKKGRNSFKFGLYEFCGVCHDLNADAVITLSYFKDTPQDAADLVAFLNAPLDQNTDNKLTAPKNTFSWPGLRAENGHPGSFQVKYFEIGNEVWHGDHIRTKEVKPEAYARRYLQYYDAMKAVDPSIQIGVVLDTDQWNKKIIPIIKNKVDFGILHSYPAPGYGKELESIPVDKLFLMCLGMPAVITEPHYQKTLKLLKQYAKRDIPLAITEFNGGFFMRSSIPYQFTLGNALINAELLRIFMKPENNILMANNWNFINEHWGMIYNGFQNEADKLRNRYHKRPNYYVFELYHNHFGEFLLNADVKSDTYQERGYTVDYITVNASMNKEQNKVYLMILNKNLKNKMSSEIILKGFENISSAEAWILNGPDYLSLNENNPDTVSVKSVNLMNAVKNGSLAVELEPHSLTAVEISK
ncbi:MAG: alpha-L-arabinofuranosidase C-terminal domain-containing protein [bacterium]|nr:alpha-L-arabinofuranosidase C-terminal domain-containing protein [bacterium]